jgi:hypothetical protein
VSGTRDRAAALAKRQFDRLQSPTGPVYRALLRRLSGEAGETTTEWPCRVLREERRALVARSGNTLATEPTARSLYIEGLPVDVEPREGDTVVMEDPAGVVDFAFTWRGQPVPLALEFHITLPDEASAGMGVLYTALVR